MKKQICSDFRTQYCPDTIKRQIERLVEIMLKAALLVLLLRIDKFSQLLEETHQGLNFIIRGCLGNNNHKRKVPFP